MSDSSDKGAVVRLSESKWLLARTSCSGQYSVVFSEHPDSRTAQLSLGIMDWGKESSRYIVVMMAERNWLVCENIDGVYAVFSRHRSDHTAMQLLGQARKQS